MPKILERLSVANTDLNCQRAARQWYVSNGLSTAELDGKIQAREKEISDILAMIENRCPDEGSI